MSQISLVKNPEMAAFSKDSTLGPGNHSLGGLSQSDMFSALVPRPPPLPGANNVLTQTKPEKQRVSRLHQTSTQVGSYVDGQETVNVVSSLD